MARQADGTVKISTELDNSGLKKNLTGMGGSLKAIFGSIAKLAGGVAIAAILKQSKQAFDAVVENETRLAQVMRNTMGASDDQIRSILALTEAQQALGIVEDDVQVAAAQELGTYLELSDSLKTLIPVMNDMLAQQYGYNATQEAGVSIATMMGKVMDGQVNALSRYGYKFTEAQEKVLKFGDESQRAATLAEVVGQSVGGMNFALAQTDVGRQRQLANTFGDIKESLGAAINQITVMFLPGLSAVANALATVANYARMAAQYVAMLFGKALSFGGAADSAGGAANNAAGAMDNMAGSAGGAAKAQDDLADATKGAGKAAKGALAAFDQLNVLQQDSGGGGGGGSGGGGGGGGGGGLPGGGAIGIMEDIEISSDMENALSAIRDWLTRVWSASEPTRKALANLWTEVQRFGAFTWEGLKGFYDNFLKPVGVWTLGEGFPRFVGAVTDGLEQVNWGNVLSALNDLWESVSKFTITAGEGLVNLWEKVISPLISATFNIAVPVFLGLLKGVIDVLTPIVEAFMRAGAWLWENFLEPLGAWVGSKVVDFLTALTGGLGDAATFLRDNQTYLDAGAEVLVSLGAAYAGIKTALAGWMAIKSGAGALATGITKIGAAIAAHPALAIAVMVGAGIIIIAGKIHEANEQAKAEELAKRFGTLTLSMEDMQAICDTIQTPFTSAMDMVKAQSEKAKTAAANVKTLNDTLATTVVEATFDISLDEDEQANLQTAVENLISGVETSITERKIELKLQTEAFFGTEDETGGGAALMAAFDAYLAPLEEQAKKHSQTLRDQMTAALQDGVIDETERKAIAETQKRLMEIMAEINSFEARIALEGAIVEFEKDGLSLESFKTLMEYIDNDVQAKLDEEDQMYFYLRAAAKVMFDGDPEGLADEMAKIETQHEINQIEIKVAEGAVRMEHFGQMLQNYADNELKNFKFGDFAGGLPDASRYFEGAVNTALSDMGDEWNIDTPYGLSEAIRFRMSELYDDFRLDATEISVAEDLLAAMDISPETVQAMIDKYAADGKAIPQALIDSITDAGMLAQLVEASKAPSYALNEGAAALIDELSAKLLADGGATMEEAAALIAEYEPKIANALSGALADGIANTDLSPGSPASEKAQEAAALVVDTVSGEVENSAEQVGEAGEAMLEGAAGEAAMTAATESGETLSDGNTTGYVDGMAAQAPAYADASEQSAEVVEEAFDGEGTGTAMGETTGEAVGPALESKQPEINESASVTGQSLEAAFVEATDGNALGANWAQAVADGATGQEAYLKAAGAKVGRALEGGTKTALDINSPSRVGEDIGENFGSAVGDSTVDTIRRITSAIVSAMDTLISRMESVISTFSPPPLEIPLTAGAFAMPNIPTPPVVRGALIPPSAAVDSSYQRGVDPEALGDMIRHIVREEGMGSDRPINLTLALNGDLAALTRVLRPQFRAEDERIGTTLITGGDYA